MIPSKESGAATYIVKDGDYSFFDDKGYLHREDGPAIEYKNGDQAWYKHGLMHREDGPAVIHKDGTCEYWQNNNLHRLDGPAIGSLDSQYEWFREGVRHREDGPAVGDKDGYHEYWLNGVEISKAEFVQRTEDPVVFDHTPINVSAKTPTQSGGTLKIKKL